MEGGMEGGIEGGMGEGLREGLFVIITLNDNVGAVTIRRLSLEPVD